MKYDLSIPIDRQRFMKRVEYLFDNSKKLELKEIRKPKSINQNSYLHVVLQLFGIYHGYTLEEAKTLLKRQYNASNIGSFTYEKNGTKFLRSCADLNSKETTDWIEWIRNLSSQNGNYIATPEEYLSNKFSIDREIQQHREFL